MAQVGRLDATRVRSHLTTGGRTVIEPTVLVELNDIGDGNGRHGQALGRSPEALGPPELPNTGDHAGVGFSLALHKASIASFCPLMPRFARPLMPTSDASSRSAGSHVRKALRQSSVGVEGVNDQPTPINFLAPSVVLHAQDLLPGGTNIPLSLAVLNPAAVLDSIRQRHLELNQAGRGCLGGTAPQSPALMCRVYTINHDRDARTQVFPRDLARDAVGHTPGHRLVVGEAIEKHRTSDHVGAQIRSPKATSKQPSDCGLACTWLAREDNKHVAERGLERSGLFDVRHHCDIVSRADRDARICRDPDATSGCYHTPIA